MENYKESLERIYELLKQMIENDSFHLSVMITDTPKINEEIKEFKENVDSLDSCIFAEVVDSLANDNISVSYYNSLLGQEELTEDEVEDVREFMEMFNALAHVKIEEKIESLQNLLERF